MTTVTVDLRTPGDGGDVPAVGVLDWAPTRRRVVDHAVVVPAAFQVRLDGTGPVDVAVAATGPDWVWTVTERVTAGQSRHVQVPDSDTPVAYADLVDVDPSTLDPAAVPEAAWWAALGGRFLVPDPTHPGLYLIASGSSLSPDPDHPGLLLMGA